MTGLELMALAALAKGTSSVLDAKRKRDEFNENANLNVAKAMGGKDTRDIERPRGMLSSGIAGGLQGAGIGLAAKKFLLSKSKNDSPWFGLDEEINA